MKIKSSIILLFFLVTAVAIISPRCKPDQAHPTNIESTGRSKKVGGADFQGNLVSIMEKLKSERVSDISVYYYDLTKDTDCRISGPCDVSGNRYVR